MEIRRSWKYEEKNNGLSKKWYITDFVELFPMNKAGIIEYLQQVSGVGQVTAQQLYIKFGDNVITELMDNSSILTKLSLKQNVMLNLQSFFKKEKENLELINRFSKELGLSSSHFLFCCKKLEQRKNQTIIQVLKQEPYLLWYYLQGQASFEKYDGFVMNNFNVAKINTVRARIAINHILMKSRLKGNTYMSLESFYSQLGKVLDLSEDTVHNIVHDADYAEITFVNDKVVPTELHQIESEIANHLYRIFNHNNVYSIHEQKEIENKISLLHLNDKQQEAVITALSSKISIITGKPGTGKTRVIEAIVAAAQQNLRIKLVAPTGKASQLLNFYSAETIHHLLEAKGTKNEFKRNEKQPIESDLLIIEETSMVDVELAYHLLAAVPSECRLVIVGDENQLQSVKEGAFLRDMIASKKFPHTVLEKVHRQSNESLIRLNADRLLKREKLYAPNGQDEFVIIDTDTKDIIKKLHHTYYNLWKSGLNPLRDIQVLTPLRQKKYQFGSINLNNFLQSSISPKEMTERQHIDMGEYILKVGDKVMQTENDYTNNVFNGEEGFITYLDAYNRTIKVTFGKNLNKVVTYKKSEIAKLNLGYATTIHKSQGSEYEAVILIIPPECENFISHDAIYTAITRAKKNIFIIGDLDLLNKKLYEERQEPRQTLLNEYLNELFLENELIESEESIFRNINVSKLDFQWNS